MLFINLGFKFETLKCSHFVHFQTPCEKMSSIEWMDPTQQNKGGAMNVKVPEIKALLDRDDYLKPHEMEIRRRSAINYVTLFRPISDPLHLWVLLLMPWPKASANPFLPLVHYLIYKSHTVLVKLIGTQSKHSSLQILWFIRYILIGIQSLYTLVTFGYNIFKSYDWNSKCSLFSTMGTFKWT